MFGLISAIIKRPKPEIEHEYHQCDGKCIMQIDKLGSWLSLCVVFECLICGRVCKMPRSSLYREMLGHW